MINILNYYNIIRKEEINMSDREISWEKVQKELEKDFTEKDFEEIEMKMQKFVKSRKLIPLEDRHI